MNMSNQNVLPLLAFQHHVGSLFIAPEEIEFVSELGVGDLAIVEKGRWHRSNADGRVCSIVVKGYKPFVIGGPEDFRELLLEASKLHRLRHPNITQFLGLGCFSHGTLAEVRESMFMVEEYVGTWTLRKLIREQMRCRLKNLYNMQTALRWAAEAASALVALHEQQPPYIHGDVKADNVFLTDEQDLTAAIAKLGDLKPHRHVYDREPSTLSQHQDRVAARQVKQSSLARHTLERSSSGSSVSWTSSANSSSCFAHQNGGEHHSMWMGKLQQQQQQQQPFMLLQNSSHSSEAGSEPCNRAPVSPAAPAAAASFSTPRKDGDGASSLEVPADGCASVRTHSMPVPIGARGGRLDGTGSCPSLWGRTAGNSLGAAEHGSGDGSAGLGSNSSLPIPACLSACEIMGTTEAKAATAAAAAQDAAADGMANEVACAPVRRRNRAICLSDSASSTTSASSGSMRAKPAVELVSLAAADDEDDTDPEICRLTRELAAADEEDSSNSSSSCEGTSPTARDQQQLQQQCRPKNMQEAWDCSAHGGFKLASLVHKAKSLPSSVQHEQQCELASSKSAPADMHYQSVCEGKVHDGHLMLLQQSESPEGRCEALVTPFIHQQKSQGVLERKLSGGAAEKQQQQQQQQQEPGVCYGWELSPSGAASPCGAVHSAMLDLFADMADEEVVLTRRLHDQYTLTPGSFVQQRVTPAGSQLVKSPQPWEPALTSSFSSTNASSQLERTGSLKGSAPSAIESKQHGGNSAFAALTAIDCIREETSSIATDSVMGSCPASRDSTAHGGVHYYRDVGLPGVAEKDCVATAPVPASWNSKGSGAAQHGSMARAFGLGSLLPMRSIASSGCGSGSGGRINDAIAAAAAAAVKEDDAMAAVEAGDSGHGSRIAAAAMRRSSGCLADKVAVLETCGSGSCEPEDHIAAGSPSSSRVDGHMAIDCSSPTAAAADAASLPPAAAPSQTKKVRFTVERAAGSTPSRDYSLLYAAPELLSGHRPTEKVDVFAFGVMLYELLSRSLLVSHCAAAVGHNRRSSRHGGGSMRGGRRSPQNGAAAATASSDGLDGPTSSADSDTELPEQQLLLAYAQMVAGGYRPQFPNHFPAAVQDLIASCWAAEPHERPRMADVLAQLQAWAQDKQLVARLNSYLAGLADIGYGPGAQAPECGCGCVIS